MPHGCLMTSFLLLCLYRKLLPCFQAWHVHKGHIKHNWLLSSSRTESRPSQGAQAHFCCCVDVLLLHRIRVHAAHTTANKHWRATVCHSDGSGPSETHVSVPRSALHPTYVHLYLTTPPTLAAHSMSPSPESCAYAQPGCLACATCPSAGCKNCSIAPSPSLKAAQPRSAPVASQTRSQKARSKHPGHA